MFKSMTYSNVIGIAVLGLASTITTGVYATNTDQCSDAIIQIYNQTEGTIYITNPMRSGVLSPNPTPGQSIDKGNTLTLNANPTGSINQVEGSVWISTQYPVPNSEDPAQAAFTFTAFAISCDVQDPTENGTKLKISASKPDKSLEHTILYTVTSK